MSEHWVDGALSDSLPLPDRGLNYGDGLFETLLFSNGRLFYLPYHLERLGLGLKRLGFPACMPTVQQHLSRSIGSLNSSEPSARAVRVCVTRGKGPRGYLPPEDSQPRVIVSVDTMATPWDKMGPPIFAGVATTHCSRQSQLAGIKHLNRLEQVLAAREIQGSEYQDLLMTTDSGEVVSMISGNIFALIDGVIRTPEISSCGVLGTRRRRLIESWAPSLGVEVREEVLTVKDIAKADEIFCTNSLVGLRAIGQFGDRQWQSHPLTNALFAQYLKENQ